eukprot:scaffold1237_cov29-Tisochrysis_lutea.AAC.2
MPFPTPSRSKWLPWASALHGAPVSLSPLEALLKPLVRLVWNWRRQFLLASSGDCHLSPGSPPQLGAARRCWIRGCHS